MASFGEPQAVYKVLQTKYLDFTKTVENVSASTPPPLFIYGIQYKQGEIVRPKIGWLYAFKTAWYADKFRKTFGNGLELKIWKCSAGIVDVPNVETARYVTDHEIQKFWTQPDYKGLPAPEGSVFCFWIKLEQVLDY